MGKTFWRLVLTGFAFVSVAAFATSTRDYAVEIAAVVQESKIRLSWRPSDDGQDWLVQRKAPTATQWNQLAILPTWQTEFIDENVVSGQTYEYSVTKHPDPTWGSGYITAGISIPLVEERGRVILLVDNTFSQSLANELATLEKDLIGDGWKVVRRHVSRNDPPPAVRNLIRNEYLADPAKTRALFLIGHVAVPRSGNYNADDHETHTGAWVADTYYADMDGNWTDSTVFNVSAVNEANRNRPGDGKFDQSRLPSDVELEVGRVDFANLDQFSPRTELELLRSYLKKNHAYRHGLLARRRRGIIYDGFGESGGDAYAASGWRNFKPLLGDDIDEIGWEQYFPTLGFQEYLWSYAAGGGDDNYMQCYGVGATANFASTDVKAVFHMIFGSFFGDWDAPDDFMRGALASGDSLAVAWAGRPHWFFHHMGIGETIGYSTRLTQNNAGLYYPTNAMRTVHISLLGDPTLRMQVVLPPSNLVANSSGGRLNLSWNNSTEPGLLGYHVYRATNATGPFVRMTSNPASQNTFSDTPASGTYTYMVRAIKKENSPSGSFDNASQGVFLTATVTAPPTPMRMSPPTLVNGQITFECIGTIGRRFVIASSGNLKTWSESPLITLTEASWTFREAISGSGKYYRIIEK